ncbi:MAG: hypothetical protein HOP14_06710 [Acidobacteria bacterium]|nr:hypothetical protein [Acidobacteriota bacterium]
MNSNLLRGVRAVIQADSDPARQVLFDNLSRSHVSVRLAHGLHERLGHGWAGALFVCGYGLATYLRIAPPRARGARVLAVAKHANARRQIARVLAWVGDVDGASVRTGTRALGLESVRAFGLLLVGGRIPTAYRIVRRLDARHGFLVACRGADVLAWYARMHAILVRRRPGAVLVSSDAQPEELGCAAAARALGVPTVFVSHAYPTPYLPPLDFSLSILEGEAALDIRRQRGPIRGQVLLAGVEGESAPLEVGRFEAPNPVVGIFTPKALSWETLSAIVDDCRRHFRARRILIRWHPSMLEPPGLSHLLTDPAGVEESPRTASLAEVAGQCDWVVAGESSNVHLQVLKLGIPTVSVKGLGLYPESRADLYGFSAGGIIFPPVASLREIRPDDLRAFFSDCWRTRFARYDASYLRPHASIGAEVRRAVRALLDGRAQAGQDA